MSDSEEEHEHEEGTVKLDPDERKSIVREVIDAVKDIVKAPATVADEVTEEPHEEQKEPVTVREQEKHAEDLVRAAVEKVTAEDEHKKQHESLKKELERPPIQYGKVTRALWGEK